MGRGRKILFSAIAVVAALLIAEFSLRIFGVDRAGAERFYQNIFDPFTLMIPGSQNPYADIVEFMNKGGLRGPDFSRKKPEGVFRIVCVGDSTTFGLVDYEDSYPYRLEEILNRDHPGVRFEVINAGIPGTNIYQHRLLFARLFEGAAPDLILLMSGANYRADLKAYREKMKRPAYKALRQINLALSHLAVYRVARRVIKGGASAKVKDDSELVIEDERYISEQVQRDYWEDMGVFDRLAKKWNFKLVFLGSVSLPYIFVLQQMGIVPDDPDYLEKARAAHYDRDMPRFADEMGWPFIDFSADFVVRDQRQEGLWVDPNHAGALGNRLIAQRVATELRARGLIPQ